MNPTDLNQQTPPETPPTAPLTEDEWTMPEETIDPVVQAEQAKAIEVPEEKPNTQTAITEKTPTFPIVVNKESRRFGKKTIGVLVAACLLIFGGGFAYASFGMPVKKETIATTDTSSSANPTESYNDVDSPADTPTGTTPEAAPVQSPATSTPTQTSPTATKPASGSTGSTPTPVPVQPTVKTYAISYTSNCYTPANITIKRGDKVTFTNNSNRDMWPASDSHPSHTNYSEFDAKQDIAPGGSYMFTFNKSGSWNYHDHSKPGCSGMVIVQ